MPNTMALTFHVFAAFVVHFFILFPPSHYSEKKKENVLIYGELYMHDMRVKRLANMYKVD